MCVSPSCPNVNRPACPKCEKCRKRNSRIRRHMRVTTAKCKMCSMLKQICKNEHNAKLQNNTNFCKECMHDMSDDDTYGVVWEDTRNMPTANAASSTTATHQHNLASVSPPTNFRSSNLAADIRARLGKLQNGELRALLRTLCRYTTDHYSRDDLITIFTYLMKTYESITPPHVIAANALYIWLRDSVHGPPTNITRKLADDIMLYLVWCVVVCMCP